MVPVACQALLNKAIPGPGLAGLSFFPPFLVSSLLPTQHCQEVGEGR